MNLVFPSSRYYLKFGLDRDPFPLKTTPNKLFLTHDLSQLLAKLTGAIKTQSETLVVTSAIGGGKSVLAEYLSYVKGSNWHVALIRGSDKLDKIALAHAIISQHFPGHRFDKQQSVSILKEFLQLYQVNGKLPVVVIDDAHLLPPDTLKFVLEISCLRHEQAQYRFVLIADKSITKQLDLPSMKDVDADQREYFCIPLFTRSQTGKYLEHRLSQAGQCKINPFNDDAIDYVFNSSKGIAGEIHKIARELMRKFVVPGRTKKIMFRAAAGVTTALLVFVTAYAGMSGFTNDERAARAAVSIALQLPGTVTKTVSTVDKKKSAKQASREVVVSNKNDRGKKVRVNSKIAAQHSNRDVLLADRKRQAEIRERKIAEEKAEMEIRAQLAAYDRLALRVSDVVQN